MDFRSFGKEFIRGMVRQVIRSCYRTMKEIIYYCFCKNGQFYVRTLNGDIGCSDIWEAGELLSNLRFLRESTNE